MNVPKLSPPSSRIVEFDLLRGFFLLVVIIDHVELFPSGYDYITGRGQLWVSAAEGFFFLSGLLVGYIYRKKLAEGMAFVFRKLWSRAALLYVCAVSLTLIFTAWALAHGNPEAIKWGAATNLGWQTIYDTLVLKYVYGWSDFLTYYVSFMLGAPIVLYLLKRGWWWLVVALSALVWLNRVDEFTRAWQVVFYGGMLAGYYWRDGQAKVAAWSAKTKSAVWRTVVWATVVTMAISFANLFILDYLHKHVGELSAGWAAFTNSWYGISEAVWPYFDKFTLEPGRPMMFLLWFAGSFLLLQRYKEHLPRYVSNSLTLLGQNSLFVYGFHSFFVFAIHAYFPKDAGLLFNFMVTTAVIALMLGLTHAKIRVKPRLVAAFASIRGKKP